MEGGTEGKGAGIRTGDSLSVGALLAEARAAQGRELSEIARETRVPLRHLMAIEADDHHALPALPYAIGFVKGFSRAVGLDPEVMSARFRAETTLEPHTPAAAGEQPAEEARLPSRGLATISLVAVVAVLGGLTLYGLGVFDGEPPPPPVAAPPTEVAAAPPPAVPAAPADASTLASTTAPETAAPAAAPAIPAAGPVVIVAREDAWVKIYDRTTRRVAFMGMMAAGSRYDVPADGPALTLRTGRAGVLELSVGGVKLPPLGGPVQTIDGVLLTAPALAARFDPNAPPPVPVPRRPRIQRPDIQDPAPAVQPQ